MELSTKPVGLQVIGVVGGPDKAEYCRQLDADLVVDRYRDDFVSAVKDFTDGHGADVIYDPVGGETYTKSTKCIAFEGRLLIIGFAGGTIQAPELNHALIKNYSIIGLHWGLYKQRDPQAIHDCHTELTRLADAGMIRPPISERSKFADTAEGLGRLSDGSTVGRIVFVQ